MGMASCVVHFFNIQYWKQRYLLLGTAASSSKKKEKNPTKSINQPTKSKQPTNQQKIKPTQKDMEE